MKKRLLLFTALFTLTVVSAQEPDNEDGTFNVGDFRYDIQTDDSKADGFFTTLVGFKLGEAVVETDTLGVETTTFPEVPVENVVVPETFNVGGNPFDVDAIGAKAFFQSDIVSVSLSSTVTSIGNEAFFGCKSLTTVNTEKVTSIGNHGFRSTGITFFDLSSMVSLGNNAINRTPVTEIKIPILEDLGDFNFVATAFESITFSSSIKSFSASAFHSAPFRVMHIENDVPFELGEFADGNSGKAITAQITVVVPTDAGVAAYEAAANWDQFGSIVSESEFIASAQFVVGYVFSTDGIKYEITSNNESETPKNEVAVSGVSDDTLTTINIPATVTNSETGEEYDVISIGFNAFVSNQVITEVVLPASVTDIKGFAFNNCTNLTSLNTENIVSIGDSVFRLTALTSLDFSSLTTSTSRGFRQADGLTSIDLPKITSLSNDAFNTALNLETITLGADLKTVTANTFKSIPSLKKVTIDAAIPPVFSDASIAFDFGNDLLLSTEDNPVPIDTTNITLVVPEGTVAAYEAAAGWSQFGTTETLSIEDIKSGNLNIQVNANNVVVNSTTTFTNASLTIYDITGRVLANQVINGASGSVNISDLASGIYIIKVAEGNAKLVKRFAK